MACSSVLFLRYNHHRVLVLGDPAPKCTIPEMFTVNPR